MKTGQTAGCQTTGKSRHFRSFIFTRQYVLIFISTRSYFLRVSWLKLLRHPLRGNIARWPDHTPGFTGAVAGSAKRPECATI
jgi:hypothetical protein